MSYTLTLETGRPFSSTPVVVMVKVRPSSETALLEVRTTLPAFLRFTTYLFGLTRVHALASSRPACHRDVRSAGASYSALPCVRFDVSRLILKV